ncbi:MAG: MFS transporter [Bacilli bacterium]|nr:MFS transporter [Bacilli bacterium]
METNVELQNEVQEESVLEFEKKNFKRNKWFFSAGCVGRDMLYTLVSTYFLQYVQFGLTLTAGQFITLSLLIGILGRIWDGVNDPMMGAIIDGSHLKWGKFKPWIFLGAILVAIFTVLLFNVHLNGWTYIAVICAIYLLWEAAFTMNDIGYWSMIPSLSRTKEHRDSITTYVVFFAGIGTVIMTALVTYFTPGNTIQAYAIYSIIGAVAILICQMVTTFGTREAPRDKKELSKENSISLKKMIKTIFHNKQLLWMSLALLFDSCVTAIILGLVYNMYYLEGGYNGNIIIFLVIYGVANPVINILYPMIAKKVSRKKIQLVTYIIVAVGLVLMALIGWFDLGVPVIVELCVAGFLTFAGHTLFYTATIVNLNNCVEYNEYETGNREEAVVTTMRPLIVKFADAIKYLIVTLTLVISGLYAITQNVSAIETQKNLFSNKLETVEEMQEYVFGYNALEGKNEEEINEIIENNKSLSNCQFNTDYVDAIGHMYIVKKDTNGKYLNSIQLKDPLSLAFILDDGSKYSLEIVVNDANGKEIHNAADEIYAAKRSLGTRLAIRFSCCIIPLIFMTAGLLIQRKKFIIDEDFFEKMMKEIEERKKTETAEVSE